jgi:5-methylcytosine-specific restriction endonuclease McrA
LCATCKGDFELKEVQVDHIIPIGETPEVPAASIEDWGKWFLKAFCAMSNLAVLCKPCHAVKTKEERRVRSIRSKRATPKARAKSRSRVA